jgi:hypothetical protein
MEKPACVPAFSFMACPGPNSAAYPAKIVVYLQASGMFEVSFLATNLGAFGAYKICLAGSVMNHGACARHGVTCRHRFFTTATSGDTNG